MKFAVGDNVRVLSTIGNDGLVGVVGQVVETIGSGNVQVAFKAKIGETYTSQGIANTWCFSDEELVKSTPTVTDDLRITPKARVILAHLKRGKSITPNEAMVVYSQPRLAAAIYEIRSIGYDVKMERRKDETGHGYSRYTLPSAIKPTLH